MPSDSIPSADPAATIPTRDDLIDAPLLPGERIEDPAPVTDPDPFAAVIVLDDEGETVFAGPEDDLVIGGAGDDLIFGEGGNDTLLGGGGDDTLIAGEGENSLVGGDGNDLLVAGTGNNIMYGDSDDSAIGDHGGQQPGDTPEPGFGNDTLIGGTGNDTMYGGSGDDKFTIHDGHGNHVIVGGETGEVEGDLLDASEMTLGVTLRYSGDERGTIDGNGATVNFSEIENVRLGSGNDYVELQATTNGTVDGGDGFDILQLPDLEEGEELPQINVTETRINEDGTATMSGHVIFADGSRLDFRNFEKIIPCFTPGTLIDTDRGAKAVEDLVPGDLVLTRDHGYRELVWTGRKAVPAAAVAAWPELAPIRIAAGALGAGQPLRDLLVSPRHRMLVGGARAELMFGERELLVAAADLVGLPGVTRAPTGAADYIHVMCEGHEIIRAEGAWTESFQPCAAVLDGLDAAARAELLRLFPELSTPEGQSRHAAAARPVLSPAEARLLVA